MFPFVKLQKHPRLGPARTSSAVATLALRCFPRCRYHAFSGNESTRSESSENTHAYFHLTSKETVRKAYKSRCAPRQSCRASPSPRPSPPSPLPWKAWKTGWSLIQDVTRPQRPASRTATQPRLPCLRSQGTSTTSEDSKVCSLQEYHRHVKK